MMKTAGKVEALDARESIKEEVRNGFKVNMSLTEKISINACIKEADTNLRMIRELADGDNARDGNGDGDGSWLDNSDDEDQRGRVGTGWPWER